MTSDDGATIAPGAERVVPLPLREGLRINTDPILRLQASLGPQGAALYLREAREELVALLALVAQAHGNSQFGRLAPKCHRVASLGLQLGLPTIRDAAIHAGDAAESGDSTASAATVARLLRLGSRAAAEMQELQGVVPR